MRPELPVLIKAREKIADPAKWGKGSRGVSRDFNTCCAAEAIEDVTLVNKEGLARRRAAFAALSKHIGSQITEWNDAPFRTHAEVLAAFDRAIEDSK